MNAISLRADINIAMADAIKQAGMHANTVLSTDSQPNLAQAIPESNNPIVVSPDAPVLAYDQMDSADLAADASDPVTLDAPKDTDDPITPTERAMPETKSAPTASSTMTRQPFDKDKTLPLFRKDLDEIFNLGTNQMEVEKEYQGKVQEKAVKGLAKILGVRRKYFDGITPEVSKALFDELLEQCKNRDLKVRPTERTTEFHLLSRLYRQSDRKQASADAKILIRAQNEQQTEATFAGWVKDLKGLNSILKGITDYERDQKEHEDASERKRQALKGNQKALFDAAKLAKWTNRWSLKHGEIPNLIDLLPAKAGTWGLILVENNGEKFRLYSPQKDSKCCELQGRDPKFSDDESPSDNCDNLDSGNSDDIMVNNAK